MAMFDALAGGPGLELAAVPPEPENVRLANEKEALGFYLTGHPLAQFQNELETFGTVQSAAGAAPA